MKLTLKECWQAQAALAELGRFSFPAKTGWEIGTVTRAVQREMDEYERQRKEKINTYGYPDKENGGNKVPVEKLDEYNKWIEELLTVEVEIAVTPLSLSELGSKELPASIFANAGWLFTDKENGERKEIAEAAEKVEAKA